MARAEFTSTDTRASVWSMTMAPPEGRFTVRAVGRLDLVLDLEAAEQRRRRHGSASRDGRMVGHHVRS